MYADDDKCQGDFGTARDCWLCYNPPTRETHQASVDLYKKILMDMVTKVSSDVGAGRISRLEGRPSFDDGSAGGGLRLVVKPKPSRPTIVNVVADGDGTVTSTSTNTTPVPESAPSGFGMITQFLDSLFHPIMGSTPEVVRVKVKSEDDLGS